MSEVGMDTGNINPLKYRTYFIVAAVLLVVAIGALIAVLLGQGDPAVATVNGEKIAKSELYEAMYNQVGKSVLDDLITRRLIAQEAKKLGLTVTEADIDEEIQRIIDENFMGMEDQFEQLLEQYGLTMESVRNDARVNLNLMARKIAETQLEISDEELKEYFADNQEKFNIPAEVKARHILVKTEEEALEVIDLLNGGADFAELAKERSEDPGSKDQGGELGFFKPGEMQQEFEDAAFSMEIGEISEPVESWYGFHVIEVLEKKSGREVTFDEVKDQVYEEMAEEKIYKLIQDLIGRLRAEANIVYK